MQYTVKEFRPGHWWVIDSTGQPIYDGSTDGNDSAAVFFDPDAADECAARLNSRPELHSCVDCGENAPESGLRCDECREAELS